MASSITDNILQIAEYNCEIVATGGTLINGYRYALKASANFDNWESQNATAAMNEEYNGDPFDIGVAIDNSDIKNNLACVSTDEQAGYVFYVCSLIYQVEGTPDLIYDNDWAAPSITPKETPKRTDRP